VREHEIYAVESIGADALDVATRRHHARPVGPPSLKLVESRDASSPERESSRPKVKVSHLSAVLSCLILVCALIYYVVDRTFDAPDAKVAPAVQLSVPPKLSPEASHATSESPQTGPVAVSSSTPQADASAAHTVSKKSATQRKAAATTSLATEPPVGTAETAKTQTPKTEAATAAVSQSGVEREEPTADAHAPASQVGTAASPNTGVSAKPNTALVMFAVSPWGEVVIDGKSAGVSPPLAELELGPGTHQVEIRNGAFPAHVVTLQLEANQAVKIKHKFTQR
jgi:cytoskeletal protein RodZ